MRWTQSLIATLRDAPQDAEIDSHKLMIRSGLIRKLAGGLYTFMPLGLRVLHKIEAIVRQEMDAAGALEILMPALQPAELWERSGRYETMGPGMFRLKDRKDARMVMGPTHEEVATDLVTKELSSYRQLPCTIYQIQTKFRDEIRPRFGLMRAKEFIMKDAYSFDISSEAADASYQKMYDAYRRIFKRCGLDARPVEADTGDIGGKFSHEFMVLADSGEDGILCCPACGYAANQEKAERRTVTPEPADSPAVEIVDTPNAGTIAQISAFLKAKPKQFIKTLIYLADGKPIAALVPGDRDLNEHKLKRLLNARALELAPDETVEQVTRAAVGFAGPVGLDVPIYADAALKGTVDRIAGANQTDRHMLHIELARDAKVTQYADLVNVIARDACPHCGQPLEMKRGIEVGHVFKLGTKYTQAFQTTCLTETGEAATLVMGCYGIGITRTLQAVIEQSHDKDGIIWPASIAPYTVAILLLDPADSASSQAASQIETALAKAGVDAIVDDREERPGVKFKDADLIGFPIRIVVGAKSLAKGGAEIKMRTVKDSTLVPVEQVPAVVADLLAHV